MLSQLEKKIFTEKCSNFIFMVDWKETDKGRVVFPRGFFGVMRNGKRAKYQRVSHWKEFVMMWSQTLTDIEREYLFETKGYTPSNIINLFFSPKVNMTTEFKNYQELIAKDGSYSENESEFKDGIRPEIMSILKDLLKQENYIYIHPLNRECTIYELILLTNPETKTFTPIGQSSDKELISMLENSIHLTSHEALKDWIQRIRNATFGEFKNLRQLLTSMMSLIIQDNKNIVRRVLNVANHPEHPNYNYLDLTKFTRIKNGETPAWDEFTNLFLSPQHRSVFMAWLWGVFDESNSGRQWLWINGPGNDGKSTVFRVIQEYLDATFGKSKMHFSANSESHKSQFFYSEVFGKRLIIFGDNKDTGLMKQEAYQRITGGDQGPVRALYSRSFAGDVYAKIMIASNYFPSINFWQGHEVSRAIVLRLDTDKCHAALINRKGEATYKQRLFDEFEAFLGKCHAEYKLLLKPEGHDLILPREVTDSMRAVCASEEMSVIEYFMAKMLVFGKGNKVRYATLKKSFEHFIGEEDSKTQYILDKMLLAALGKEHGCILDMSATKSNVRTQYVFGCSLKAGAPTNTYAQIIRQEDAEDSISVIESEGSFHLN